MMYKIEDDEIDLVIEAISNQISLTQSNVDYEYSQNDGLDTKTVREGEAEIKKLEGVLERWE